MEAKGSAGTDVNVATTQQQQQQQQSFSPMEMALVTILRQRQIDPQQLIKGVESLQKEQEDLFKGTEDCAVPDRSDDAWEVFESWLSDNGCPVPESVQIAHDLVEGSGIVATQDIDNGELIFRIPVSVMMTVENALSSDLRPIIAANTILKQYPDLALTAFLLAESRKGSASFWSPYVNVLPRDYNLPLYWPCDVLTKTLQGTSRQLELMSFYMNCVRQYIALSAIVRMHPNVFGTKPFTWNEWRWALSAVLSRQNALPLGEGCAVLSLIPLWDLCNHRSGRFSTDYSPDTKELVSFAQCAFDKGEQVYIHYGDRKAWNLVMRSGFCLRNSPCDDVGVTLRPEATDPLLGQRARFVRLSPIKLSTTLLLGPSAHMDPLALVLARVLTMTEQELSSASDLNTRRRLFDQRQPLTLANEVRALSFIRDKLEARLSAFPTTIAEDEEWLRVHGADAKCRAAQCATLLSVLEKERLVLWIKRVTDMLQDPKRRHQKQQAKKRRRRKKKTTTGNVGDQQGDEDGDEGSPKTGKGE